MEWMEVGMQHYEGRKRHAWVQRTRTILAMQLTFADFVLTCNERQRDSYIGMMISLGLISPRVYDNDPTLRRYIDSAPHGIRPSCPSRRTRSSRRPPGLRGDGQDHRLERRHHPVVRPGHAPRSASHPRPRRHQAALPRRRLPRDQRTRNRDPVPGREGDRCEATASWTGRCSSRRAGSRTSREAVRAGGGHLGLLLLRQPRNALQPPHPLRRPHLGRAALSSAPMATCWPRKWSRTAGASSSPKTTRRHWPRAIDKLIDDREFHAQCRRTSPASRAGAAVGRDDEAAHRLLQRRSAARRAQVGALPRAGATSFHLRVAPGRLEVLDNRDKRKRSRARPAGKSGRTGKGGARGTIRPKEVGRHTGHGWIGTSSGAGWPPPRRRPFRGAGPIATSL